jgi:hypothetical protein
VFGASVGSSRAGSTALAAPCVTRTFGPTCANSALGRPTIGGAASAVA